MSGGYWDYADSSLMNEIFRNVKSYHPTRKEIRTVNPLEDVEISELVWDVFDLLHSYDWYASGDTGEQDYREDVEAFKKKWFKRSAKERVQEEVDSALEIAREQLYTEFGLNTE